MTKAHDFYVEILKGEFQQRKKRNGSYSLRGFARDLQIPSSNLSEILRKKKGLSEKSANKIGYALGLSSLQSRLFCLSTKAAHAKSKSDRLLAQQQFQELYVEKSRHHFLKTTDLTHVHSWISYAIMELFELDGFQFDEKWIAAKLGLQSKDVRDLLQEMIRQNWISKTTQGYIPTYQETEVQSDKPSRSIKDFHLDVMKRATESLELSPVLKREFSNLTLAFDRSQVDRAKKFLRDFQRQFIKEFYTSEKKKNSVYQLSLQFFRLDQGD